MDQRERFFDYLAKAGLKSTRARGAILAGIAAYEGHFDAEELHEFLRDKGAAISRATLYRTLPLFVKSGIIRETLSSSGRTRYEHLFGHEHHDHLECISCGRIIEFKVDEIERLQNRLCRERDFLPLDHRLSIRGLCASCARKRRAV
jgi:Fur family ferric uptake transcriptional regulator